MVGKKVTLATIKSFIKKNAKNLYISNRSNFDGMIDGIRSCDNKDFRKVEAVDLNNRQTCGIDGAWFVRDSRDYFNAHEDEKFVGYEVSNCCGCFILAIPRE